PRLVERIDHERTALIGLNANRVQSHAVGSGGSALRPPQYVALYDLVRFEKDTHAVTVGFHALVFLTVPDQHTTLAQMIGQGVDNFIVEERQQLVAIVDQIHLDAQTAEDRRVFAAHHAGAIDRNAARRALQMQHGVAVDDV